MDLTKFREQLRAAIYSLPDVRTWPELADLFLPQPESTAHTDWELPLLTCEAVGGAVDTAVPAAAAIACLQMSIMLVDDMLDDDPRGMYHVHGVGPTANVAQALQAMAFELMARADLADGQKAAAQACLARAALATAVGQYLDAQNLQGEANYWRVVEAKSTPFYGCAYELGGIVGGAGPAVCDGLHTIGKLVGELIQIQDDLQDALAQPANADWTQGRNNLLLLYATTAVYDGRERFVQLREQAADPACLDEAQQMLIRSGAVSFAVANLLVRYQKAQVLLAGLDLPNPAPLRHMLARFGEGPLLSLLRAGGVDLNEQVLQQSLTTRR